MIVRQFISWIRTAPAGERAEATRALARAWLISDLSEDDRAAAEGALLMQLDDASPLVRQAMAEVFCRGARADRKRLRGTRAIFMGSHCRAPRPSGRDPGIDAGAGGSARSDQGSAGRKTVGYAGAVRG